MPKDVRHHRTCDCFGEAKGLHSEAAYRPEGIVENTSGEGSLFQGIAQSHRSLSLRTVILFLVNRGFDDLRVDESARIEAYDRLISHESTDPPYGSQSAIQKPSPFPPRRKPITRCFSTPSPPRPPTLGPSMAVSTQHTIYSTQ